jgi:hypothetical protein
MNGIALSFLTMYGAGVLIADDAPYRPTQEQVEVATRAVADLYSMYPKTLTEDLLIVFARYEDVQKACEGNGGCFRFRAGVVYVSLTPESHGNCVFRSVLTHELLHVAQWRFENFIDPDHRTLYWSTPLRKINTDLIDKHCP